MLSFVHLSRANQNTYTWHNRIQNPVPVTRIGSISNDLDELSLYRENLRSAQCLVLTGVNCTCESLC